MLLYLIACLMKKLYHQETHFTVNSQTPELLTLNKSIGLFSDLCRKHFFLSFNNLLSGLQDCEFNLKSSMQN